MRRRHLRLCPRLPASPEAVSEVTGAPPVSPGPAAGLQSGTLTRAGRPWLSMVCLTLAMGCRISTEPLDRDGKLKEEADAGTDAGAATPPQPAEPDMGPPIKVGLLYSLSGPLALHETSLRDMALMAIAEINERGGIVLNRRKKAAVNQRGGADMRHRLSPIVLDGASNWPMFEDKAQELLKKDRVPVIFGAWATEARRSVIRALARRDGLLFYAVPYEGEESSFHVFYTGTVPDQQAVSALRYLTARVDARRFALIATDSLYGRTVNKVAQHYLLSEGVLSEDILKRVVPADGLEAEPLVQQLKEFAGAEQTIVLSTLGEDESKPFFRELTKQGVKPKDTPVLTLTVGEKELESKGLRAAMAGHFAASSYFMALTHERNQAWVARWQRYAGEAHLQPGAPRVITGPMEATYVGVHLWARAVQQAGTVELDAVRQAMAGQTFAAPSGVTVKMDAKNHHLHKPIFVGRIQADGRVDVLWRSADPVAVAPRPYSPYVPETANRVADWTYPWLCGGCTEPRIRTALAAPD